MFLPLAGANFSQGGVLSAIWCPDCWSSVRYIGAGCFACDVHGEVVPINLAAIIPLLKESKVTAS